MLRIKNRIEWRSHIDDSGQLVTSSPEVCRVIQKSRLSSLKGGMANSSCSARMTNSPCVKPSFKPNPNAHSTCSQEQVFTHPI
jgi:hypothetical protein